MQRKMFCDGTLKYALTLYCCYLRVPTDFVNIVRKTHLIVKWRCWNIFCFFFIFCLLFLVFLIYKMEAVWDAEENILKFHFHYAKGALKFNRAPWNIYVCCTFVITFFYVFSSLLAYKLIETTLCLWKKSKSAGRRNWI